MKKNGIKVDLAMQPILAKHAAEFDEIFERIDEVLDGKSYGVGAIALQMAYIILINDADDEQRSWAIDVAQGFLELNRDKLELTMQ